MRVFVTGSHGFIGRALVSRLKQEGHTVSEFDIKNNALDSVTNITRLFTAFQYFKPDVCIHLAALVSRWGAEDDPERAVRVNINGTNNVAQICASNGVRLINFSTSEVYADEECPDILAQNGYYGLTKLAAEGVVAHLRRTGGLEACNVRPFMVYGPGEEPSGVYRSVLSNFVDTAINGGVLVVHDGAERSWCYIDDFVTAVVGLLGEELLPEEYDIGTHDMRSIESLAVLIIDVVGQGTYDVVPMPENFVSRTKCARDNLIPCPLPLEEGVLRTVEWQVNR